MFVLLVATAAFLISHVTTQEYITYRPGNCGIILTSPHGGYLEPASIPDRDYGCRIDGRCVYSHTCGEKDPSCRTTTTRDGYTKELTELVEAELISEGLRPYVVINNLARVKLDANREIQQAAFGVSDAEDAYNLYTNYINQAKQAIGRGVLFDIHGVASHSERWIEVGYRISKTQLNEDTFTASDSSIRALGTRECGGDNDCFDDLVRGNTSFGQMLATTQPGRPVIPSPDHPRPGPSGGYYRGGYTTDTHGSIDGGQIDAIQIESPAPLRGADTSPLYAQQLASAIEDFYTEYYQ